MKRVLFNTIFLALLLAPALAEAIPAFPSAEGAGAVAVGGREGAVIEVRNLEDSGPDSFRACVEATGPRTCVFRMGGTITLRSYVFIRNPYLTIAGQTAPGGGIQIRGHGIYVSPPAHDIPQAGRSTTSLLITHLSDGSRMTTAHGERYEM